MSSSKYYKDDARVEAVLATCNLEKTWGNHTEQALAYVRRKKIRGQWN